MCTINKFLHRIINIYRIFLSTTDIIVIKGPKYFLFIKILSDKYFYIMANIY